MSDWQGRVRAIGGEDGPDDLRDTVVAPRPNVVPYVRPGAGRRCPLPRGSTANSAPDRPWMVKATLGERGDGTAIGEHADKSWGRRNSPR